MYGIRECRLRRYRGEEKRRGGRGIHESDAGDGGTQGKHIIPCDCRPNLAYFFMKGDTSLYFLSMAL